MLDIYARAVNVCSYHSQSTTFGSEATYTCLVGFRFNVSDADDIERAIECDARGNWTTDTATKCERKNGFVVHINDVCLAVRMVLQLNVVLIQVYLRQSRFETDCNPVLYSVFTLFAC